MRLNRRHTRVLAVALTVAGATGFLVAPGGAAVPPNLAWAKIPRLPLLNPTGRSGHVMAYHAANSHTVMFGGFGNLPLPSTGSALLGDTWTWNGVVWTQAMPTASPPARTQATMAFDGQRTVLFGGGDGLTTVRNDTWMWNGTTWSQFVPLPLATLPAPRDRAVMAYHPATQQIVLFGGRSASGLRNDTWVWNPSANAGAGTWTDVTPAVRPRARYDAVMSLAADGNLVLHGGIDGLGTFADTWEWNGTTSTWTEVFPSTVPLHARGAVMAYNSVDNYTLKFGGTSSVGPIDHTDSWDGANWTRLNPASKPPASFDGAMAYDAARNQFVFFNGDTWLFALIPSARCATHLVTLGTAPNKLTIATDNPSPSSTRACVAIDAGGQHAGLALVLSGLGVAPTIGVDNQGLACRNNAATNLLPAAARGITLNLVNPVGSGLIVSGGIEFYQSPTASFICVNLSELPDETLTIPAVTLPPTPLPTVTVPPSGVPPSPVATVTVPPSAAATATVPPDGSPATPAPQQTVTVSPTPVATATVLPVVTPIATVTPQQVIVGPVTVASGILPTAISIRILLPGVFPIPPTGVPTIAIFPDPGTVPAALPI